MTSAPSFDRRISAWPSIGRSGSAGTREVDAHSPDQKLVVQLDGFEFHRTRRDRERDAASDADLELAGHRVMRFTWDDATVHGERTLRRIRLAGGWATRTTRTTRTTA